MTPEQMKKRSSEKVKQVMDLMKELHLRVEAREKVDQGGFIEKMVFWIDEEKYPSGTNPEKVAGPTGETNV